MNFTGKPQAPGRRGGFTLVEMLAALAVFMLILGMLSQIFNNTVAATQASRQQLDASQQNRLVLEALRADLANLVTLEEAATVFVEADSAGDRLVFLTRSRGPQGTMDYRFLAVAYELDGNTLTRRSAPVTWEDADLLAGAFTATTSSARNFLSSSALRFKITVNLDNGSSVPLGGTGPWVSNDLRGKSVPEGYSALLLANGVPDPAAPRARSLTVTVAAVDPVSLRLPGASGLGSALGGTTGGQGYLEAWLKIQNDGEQLESFPRPAVNALRMEQSTYTLAH
jgi:type II secretory pathway component PulJ